LSFHLQVTEENLGHVAHIEDKQMSTVSLPNWYFDESKMTGVDFEDVTQVEAFDLKQPSSTPEKEQNAGVSNIQFHRAGFLTYDHRDRPT
jgi:hypothetical protein